MLYFVPMLIRCGLGLGIRCCDQFGGPLQVIVDINQVRDQIEEYMSVRIETLTEKKVTRLLAFVIRDHLVQ